MDQIFLVGLIASAFRLGTPILFAALGETVAQRSGVLNVGIEGIMLVGAFVGVWGSFVGGSLAQLLNIEFYGWLGNFIVATLGAVLILWLWRRFRGPSY